MRRRLIAVLAGDFHVVGPAEPEPCGGRGDRIGLNGPAGDDARGPIRPAEQFPGGRLKRLDVVGGSVV